MNFQEITKELLELGDSQVFRLHKIQSWLVNYSDLYKQTYDFVHSQHLYKDYDGSTIRLPLCCKPNDEEIFLSLYESLNGILELHANETYFEEEMVEYYKIENSPVDTKLWIAKNEDLGAKEYVSFMLDYLDYDKNDRVYHLKIYIHSSKELEIYIDRQDFKNTIDFLSIFNELYWINEYFNLNK